MGQGRRLGASPDANDATDLQSSDQGFAGFAADTDGAASPTKRNGDATAPPLPSPNPTRDLAVDLALGREVYRTTVDRYRAGKAKASEVRDAAVAMAVVQDKATKAGVPGTGQGGEWAWAGNRAQARNNIPLLRQWLASVKERIAAEGGSWTV